jgi:hypothetical protein
VTKKIDSFGEMCFGCDKIDFYTSVGLHTFQIVGQECEDTVSSHPKPLGAIQTNQFWVNQNRFE